ncbi:MULTISPECIES: dipicolinate synthase subunit DpsA [Paenibacillus]|uniref:Dipicolinate synthase subunit DpsA n=1 Tax=Paenibacillus campinasensis TaxID=66347 RepID=A0A268ES09_9BACL|nr:MULTISPECIES: dipicolinate synthase subunit DpsA [Paenibacillus]MUG66706.1 dipicolinate synthase subunit DpsA [Paenibacillus campinasensis]PAD75928.1 dipicolinic acid synthetase subunit A [Paenibacillus campinasensis]PAK54670.1 dipicolinic acid synthetase subunit A [Paenibacillus sp. 7541]
MLTGIRTVFVGGDARQIEVIRKCADMDASVKIAGFEKLQEPFQGVTREPLTPELLAEADALVLPVVGCDDEGRVSALFSEGPLKLQEEHIAAMPKNGVVYTGMAKHYLRTLCNKYRIKLVEILERDDVAIYNSIPTAEGALMMAIQNTDFTIHGSTSMVLGMGRTGFTMARSLQGLGATVKMGVRKSEHFARAEEMGWKPFMIKDLGSEVVDVDLLFNTIPTMIVTAQIISKMPREAVIIDLASAPGGCDFRYAEKRGIKAMLAPGLPGIVAPKTAGIILANALVELISEEIKIRGEA